MKTINYCKLEECESKVRGNGYCNRHYLQYRRHGKTFTTRFDKRDAIIDKDIAKIPLGIEGKDGYTVVDKDYAYLDKYRWYKANTGYASGKINGKRVLLHTVISGEEKGKVTDHINRDKLDNRTQNLRLVTQRINVFNSPLIRSDNTTGFRGVHFSNRDRKYIAEIVSNGRKVHIGTFTNKTEAAEAYDRKAKQMNGTLAKLNFEGGLI